jgi:hypothetical protein
MSTIFKNSMATEKCAKGPHESLGVDDAENEIVAEVLAFLPLLMFLLMLLLILLLKMDMVDHPLSLDQIKEPKLLIWMVIPLLQHSHLTLRGLL